MFVVISTSCNEQFKNIILLKLTAWITGLFPSVMETDTENV